MEPKTIVPLYKSEFPRHQAQPRPEAKLPFLANAKSLRLWGTCGDGVTQIADATQLDLFVKSGAGGVLMGCSGSVGSDTPFFGEVLKNQQFGAIHQISGHVWVNAPASAALVCTQLNATKLWWFSDQRMQSKIAAKLQDGMNPHFPGDEIAFLPGFVSTESEAADQADAEDDAFSNAFTKLEQINCPTLNSTEGLATYCCNVPLTLRSLKRVSVNGEVTSAEARALRAMGNEPTASAVVDNLALVFSNVNGAAPHTLILKACSNDLVCAVVEAQLPRLARLVLKNSPTNADPKVDLDQLLPLVAKNKHLEELSFTSDSCHLDSGTIELVRNYPCPHVSFNVKPDLAVPPPKAAAAHQPLEPNPLQGAMKVGEFTKLCKEQEEAKMEQPPIALATASWGQVVPLGGHLINRFQLLAEMLEDNKEEEAGAGENIVPMEIDPPVGKESVALAVHFVSHYVTEEVERECVKAEQLRGAAVEEAPVAGGGGGEGEGEGQSEKKADPDGGDEGTPVTYTWCPDFAQFHTLHIQQRYMTSQRRVQVMCELMAIACYLNCPSLKRFLRAAFVMENEFE